ncbi:MAG: type II secretion system GspH family protein [Roseburia sp.]|nr:type II secretion system GspH family protein [Roseburia sp.]MCM1278058.1 type II secretion system GspH family protein [Robinsoniella sp.]
MKENKGFSLIELIVIMAVMGIVITFGVIKSDVLFSYRAQEAYKKVVNTLTTEKVQVLAHSKLTKTVSVKDTFGGVNTDIQNDGVYIEFYKYDNSIYAKTYVMGVAKEEKGNKIAGRGVTMICKGAGLTDEELVGGEGNGIMFSYDRSTGAFLPYKDGKYIEEIYILGGSRQYELKLMKKTGKVVRKGR